MAVLPDGLGGLVEWAIKLSFMNSLEKAWTITGQAIKGTFFTPSDADILVVKIIQALAPVFYETIWLHGGVVRRYVPRTIEPNPDPPEYNPSNHVAVAYVTQGEREFAAGEQMFYDQVWDLNRLPLFGNIGRIEVRGALLESDVDETFTQKSLADEAVYIGLASAFNTAMGEGEELGGYEIVMAGEPLDEVVRTVVDNVLHEVRTYGETIVRDVQSWASGTVRSDKGKSAWFNSNRIGG